MNKVIQNQLFILMVGLSLATPRFAQGGASEAASTAATAAMQIAVVSAATGSSLKTPCVSGSALACGMMAIAAYQVISALSDSDSSSSSSDSTSSDSSSTLTTDGSSGSSSDSSGSSSTSSLASDLVTSAKEAIATAEASGVTVSSDGSSATTSDGRTVDSSSTGSKEGAQAAGFSAKEYSDVQAALASAASNLKNTALTNDAGGGGAAAKKGGEADTGTGAMDDFAKRLAAQKLKKKEASVAGLSKKLGDDNIGVAQDNIFEMISRRYKAEDKANAFLKE